MTLEQSIKSHYITYLRSVGTAAPAAYNTGNHRLVGLGLRAKSTVKMAEQKTHIVFSEFVELINEQRVRNETMSVEHAVAAVIDSDGHRWTDALNVQDTVTTDIEYEIFGALVVRPDIRKLSLYEPVDASCVPALLDRLRHRCLQNFPGYVSHEWSSSFQYFSKAGLMPLEGILCFLQKGLQRRLHAPPY